ncbi:MAG: YdcF family protein [Alphaproteobacteria bacterium]|nr:YdcF family protein [Alphaproteobacteria bacterium]
MRWSLAGLAVLAVLGLGLVLAGLAAFVDRLPSPDDVPAPVHAGDGVVVPTGGAERIATGLDLLAEGAGRLLITGINPEVSLNAVLAQAGQARPSCCLDIDRGAANTVGNARAAALWVREHGIRRLHLVTSWYHMPRSRLLFARALPGITLLPHPVFPAQRPEGRWWRDPAGWRVVLVEYGKYVWALFSPWDSL